MDLTQHGYGNKPHRHTRTDLGNQDGMKPHPNCHRKLNICVQIQTSGTIQKQKRTLQLYTYPYAQGVVKVVACNEGVGLEAYFTLKVGRRVWDFFSEGWGTYRLLEKISLHKTM